MDHSNHTMMMNMTPSTSPTMNNMTMMPRKRGMMMHMSFYWGHQAIVLFTGWPGASPGMYVLSLVLVFALAFVVEASRALNPTSGPALALLHGLRVGLAYMVMLAVMSFNAGVFIVAIVGHAVGFLVFGTRVFGLGPKPGQASGLPEMSC